MEANRSESDNNNVQYGSVASFEDVEDAQYRDYQLGESYYLKPTKAEERRDLLKVVGPMLVFILIMCGIAYALANDFDHLYPGRGGSGAGGSQPREHYVPPPPLPQDSSGDARPAQVVEVDPNSPHCIDHESCEFLTGDCCPTTDGLFLDCCAD